MKSLALRLTLLGLFVAVAGVAAYFSWTAAARVRHEAAALSAFQTAAVSVERDILALRAAQQGYVAAGQGDPSWASKVDAGVSKLRETLASLRTQATTSKAQAELDNASSAVQDFEQMDHRARDYAHNGQKLLASDLIFANGFDLTDAAAGAVEEARAAEWQAHMDLRSAANARSLAPIGVLIAAGLFVIAALLPRGTEPVPVAAVAPQTTSRVTAPRLPARPEVDASMDEGWSAAKVVPKAKPAARQAPVSTPAAAHAVTPAPQSPSPAPVARVAAPAAGPPPVDLAGVASLCSDLARVTDTQALPALLERAATVLDAPGIVLWIADPDGRELSPIVTHGYPPQLVSRLGTILRDSENATASAFRTALLQTVKTDAVSNGAIAAPLMTPAGCVGVMAAEVRNRGEQDTGKLAVATIVAAQLATLVGPPSVRTQARVEAAGA
jgi:CHASE3 domain sensor protein